MLRIKKNIKDGDLGLDFINLLKPRKFNKVNPAKYPDSIRKPLDGVDINGTETEWTDAQANKVWDGLIAQEVKEVIDNNPDIKEGFDMWKEDDTDGRQRIGESALIPMLVKAIQELSAEVEQLKSKAHDKCDNNGE